MVSGNGKTRAYLHRKKNYWKGKMSLQQGRSDYGPPATPLQATKSTEGKTSEGYIETWNLANKQSRFNN